MSKSQRYEVLGSSGSQQHLKPSAFMTRLVLPILCDGLGAGEVALSGWRDNTGYPKEPGLVKGKTDQNLWTLRLFFLTHSQVIECSWSNLWWGKFQICLAASMLSHCPQTSAGFAFEVDVPERVLLLAKQQYVEYLPSKQTVRLTDKQTHKH